MRFKSVVFLLSEAPDNAMNPPASIARLTSRREVTSPLSSVYKFRMACSLTRGVCMTAFLDAELTKGGEFRALDSEERRELAMSGVNG